MKNCRIGNAFPMGATVIGKNTVQFVSLINQKNENSLILYNKKTGMKEEYKLSDDYRIGNMYSIVIEDLDPANYTYNYLENGKEITDLYAKVIYGNEVWGNLKEPTISAGIKIENFKWEDDKNWRYPYNESVLYQLHVRGFTKHASSGVKKKGTFEGICEKIPYLQELGITAIELLPAYEFMECEKILPKVLTMEYVKENYKDVPEDKPEKKINYWGFKEAYYFAPKASYSSSKNPVNSFKNMVRELHKAGIEVIMQFYFPQTISRSLILEVVKYWVREYHIDGVRLLGVNLPISVISTLPELLNTKIMYENIPENDIYDYKYVPAYANLANYNEGYLYAVRKFLKGDVGSLPRAFQAMTSSYNRVMGMNYLTNYNTFTLKDLVSYDRKHNEENGENGRDGNNYNLSWNCGIEGITKKKPILTIRERQMRNAIVMLMLAKGTPVILAGDEFGNSQGGNNNPYCQDNIISWLNWKDLQKNHSHFEFTKKMISYRKEMEILKKTKETSTKRTGLEYPYMSFHGTEAWKLEWNESNEEAGGILYYSDYTYLYIGFNMHWQDNTLALPKLPGNHKWEIMVDTSMDEKNELQMVENSVLMPPRTIKILKVKASKEDFNEDLSAF
ncbi:MAG: hypothetical protein IKW30_08685 [Lachnospiraceae bacterium]|nr:hypothetical protein [Lachnospiraceae bacterium]